jgi:hypothetical protein
MPVFDDDWTPQFAEDLARAEGILLGEKEWCVIADIREALARGGDPAEWNEFLESADPVYARLAGALELERRK